VITSALLLLVSYRQVKSRLAAARISATVKGTVRRAKEVGPTVKAHPEREENSVKRLVGLMTLTAVSLAVFAGAQAVAADGPVKQFQQSVALGFFRGQVISYLDFGPVKLAKGNKVAPIWAVTNGVTEQRNIVDTVPGMASYSPLWAVRMVTWKDGVTPRLLRSAAAVQAALRAGEVTVKVAPVVVNCPVL
jgi:hypothetical protein